MCSASFAQTQSFWLKLSDPRVLNESAWETLTRNLQISQVTQALSNSRSTDLLNVYELECVCSKSQLESEMKTLGISFLAIERAPQYEVLYVPNDFSNIQAPDYSLSLINAPQAWDLTQGGDSVLLAISDQNFSPLHEDLEGKVVFYDATNTTTPTHGTAVAIVAAGKTDNGMGLSSIGFNTKLALYKMTYNEVLLAAYSGADIINVSWTSGCFYSQIEQDVMTEVHAQGAFVIASAGNGNTCGYANAHVYPASYGHVFSVTSVGPSNNHERYIGDNTSTHQHNDSVDLAAPGYDVAISPAPGWYLNSSGTSFAAAYVSGTVALMLAANECMSNVEIEAILKSTAFPINNLNTPYAGLIGAGRLDAYQAVLAASNVMNPVQPTVVTSDACEAADAGISVGVTGGQSPYSITWGNGMLGLVQNNLSAGSYYLHIEDAHGCRFDTLINLSDLVPPVYTVLSANPTCFESANGMLEVNPMDSNVLVLWSQGGSGPVAYGLSGGPYEAYLNYGLNCVDTVLLNLVAPAELVVSSMVSPINGNTLGAIDLTVSGGTAPYQYFWQGQSASEDLNDLQAGPYDVLIMDANGCQFEASYTVEQTNGEEAIEPVLLLSLYPNPNDGYFQLTGASGSVYDVTVYDASGRLIWSSQFTGQTQVNIDLKPGEYFLKVEGNQVSKVFKMIRL